MNVIAEVLLVIITGAVVFITAYFILKMFLDNESKKRTIDYKTQNTKLILPIRLQAYERIILFLERISPNSLIIRLQVPGMQSLQLQKELHSLIRAEFEHNFSQQIYMSDKAWDVACTAKENVIKLINLAAQKVAPNAPAMDLSQIIIEAWMSINPSPTHTAIIFIKNEVNQLFN